MRILDLHAISTVVNSTEPAVRLPTCLHLPTGYCALSTYLHDILSRALLVSILDLSSIQRFQQVFKEAVSITYQPDHDHTFRRGFIVVFGCWLGLQPPSRSTPT